MQFSNLFLAVAAVASLAQATVILTPVTFAGITVGTAFNISWADALGPVTLKLKTGPATALTDVETLSSGLPSSADGSGAFSWTPESTLPAGTYAIEITDGTTTNYGTLFELLGATASPSASSGASSTPSGSASSAATTSGSATTTAPDSSATSGASSTGNSSSGSKTTGSQASKTATGASTSSTTSAPGSASGLASPLAMVLLAFAAVLSFN